MDRDLVPVGCSAAPPGWTVGPVVMAACVEAVLALAVPVLAVPAWVLLARVMRAWAVLAVPRWLPGIGVLSGDLPAVVHADGLCDCLFIVPPA